MPRGVARVPEPREWLLTKRCSRCSVVRPWAHFPPKVYWPDGSIRQVAAQCRRCDSRRGGARAVEHRRRNRDRINAYRRDWWQRQLRENVRYLPVEPFRDLLLANLDRFGTWQEFGAVVDMDASVLRRAAKSSSTVSLSVVDRCTTRLGVHISELYPELDSGAALPDSA